MNSIHQVTTTWMVCSEKRVDLTLCSTSDRKQDKTNLTKH